MRPSTPNRHAATATTNVQPDARRRAKVASRGPTGHRDDTAHLEAAIIAVTRLGTSLEPAHVRAHAVEAVLSVLDRPVGLASFAATVHVPAATVAVGIVSHADPAGLWCASRAHDLVQPARVVRGGPWCAYFRQRGLAAVEVLSLPLASAPPARMLVPGATTFAPSELRRLQIVTPAIAAALRNVDAHAAAYRSGLIDHTTGLYNCRFFELALERELARCTRSGQPVSVLAIDLDDFKVVNDTLGHLRGSDVLRAVGEIIGRSIRTADLCARIGGDEFAALLIGADGNAAATIANRIRSAVATFDADSATSVRLTVSIGVATAPCEGSAPLQLLAVADRRLYAAKAAGRNRVDLRSNRPGA